MEKKVIGIGAVIILALCVAYYYVFSNPDSNIAPTPSDTSKSTESTTPVSYKNGSYVGKRSDAFYGFIQVRATISGSKLTKVEFLETPQDSQNSFDINNHAMPILSQEAISAQSADVDGITGATDTVRAFQQSLSDALSQARA